MKKIFVCLLAVAALAACQKNEVISTVQGPAIAFENAFVDNATKAAVDPSTTTASIEEFSVWGYMDTRDGAIFNEELVSKSGSDWSYQNTQYWVPNHTYYFAAVSPVKHADVKVTPETSKDAAHYGLGTIDFTNTDGTNDLLYTATTATTGAEVSAMPKVGLTFCHLLSKVKFTFTNGFDNANSTLVITGLEMTAPKTGTIDLNVENWWDNDDWKLGADETKLAFGNVNGGEKLAAAASAECADERLTIPASKDQVYTVTFKVALYNGAVLATEQELEATVTGVALEMGKAYNFTAEINASNIMGPDSQLYPIEFEVVEVKEWVEAGTQTGVLAGAVEDQTLVTDVNATETVNLNGLLDGAGHTVAAVAGVDYVVSNTARLIEANAPATIMNMVIDGKGVYTGEYGIRGIYTIGNGDITIDNVEIINCTYAINANHTGKLTVVNSTLQGWNSYGPNTTNHFENVKFIDGQFHNFRPYNNTVCVNCDFGTGVVIDLSCMVDGATIEFVNCTVNGAALTEANLSDAPATGVTIK